jgi:GNAT superfamily N-acetyltransferase
MESPAKRYSIVHKQKLVVEDVQSIAAPLQKYNLAAGPPTTFKQVALALEDCDGKIVGGLWGQCGYSWLHVEYLVVPEDARGSGLGAELLRQAETIAAEHGCVGVWLSTLTFQARPFYEKQGYVVFAQIDDFPPGGAHFFMRKALEPVVPKSMAGAT